MKTTLKFLLSLGDCKMVVLGGENGDNFYAASDNTLPPVRRTNLKRIAATLGER